MHPVIDSRSIRFDSSRHLALGLKVQRFTGEGYADDAYLPELACQDLPTGRSRLAENGSTAAVELFDLDLDLAAHCRSVHVQPRFGRGHNEEQTTTQTADTCT